MRVLNFLSSIHPYVLIPFPQNGNVDNMDLFETLQATKYMKYVILSSSSGE